MIGPGWYGQLVTASDRLQMHTDAYQPLSVHADTFTGLLDQTWQYLSQNPDTCLVYMVCEKAPALISRSMDNVDNGHVQTSVMYTHASTPDFSRQKASCSEL